MKKYDFKRLCNPPHLSGTLSELIFKPLHSFSVRCHFFLSTLFPHTSLPLSSLLTSLPLSLSVTLPLSLALFYSSSPPSLHLAFGTKWRSVMNVPAPIH